MVDGECLVNSRILSEVVRKMATGEVVFSDLGNEVMIETEKSEYKLRKLDHLTYPKALLEKSFDEEESQELAPTELFLALRKVGIAASPEGGKPILTGVYFDNEGEKTTLVSTDSYRLATNTISNLPIKDAGIISFRSLNETIKLFEDVEGKIFINSTERELHFYNEKYYTSVRKLEIKLSSNQFKFNSKKNNILQSAEASVPINGSMYFAVTEEERFGIAFLRLLIEKMPNLSNLSKSLTQIIDGFDGKPALFKGDLNIKSGLIQTDNLNVKNQKRYKNRKGWSYQCHQCTFCRFYYRTSKNVKR